MKTKKSYRWVVIAWQRDNRRYENARNHTLSAHIRQRVGKNREEPSWQVSHRRLVPMYRINIIEMVSYRRQRFTINRSNHDADVHMLFYIWSNSYILVRICSSQAARAASCIEMDWPRQRNKRFVHAVTVSRDSAVRRLFFEWINCNLWLVGVSPNKGTLWFWSKNLFWCIMDGCELNDKIIFMSYSRPCRSRW